MPGPHCTIARRPILRSTRITVIPHGDPVQRPRTRAARSRRRQRRRNGRKNGARWEGYDDGYRDRLDQLRALSTYGSGLTVRPAKGATPTGGTMTFRIPPLYRNPLFFTVRGQPKLTSARDQHWRLYSAPRPGSGQTRASSKRAILSPVRGTLHDDGRSFGWIHDPPSPLKSGRWASE